MISEKRKEAYDDRSIFFFNSQKIVSLFLSISLYSLTKKKESVPHWVPYMRGSVSYLVNLCYEVYRYEEVSSNYARLTAYYYRSAFFFYPILTGCFTYMA